MQAPKALQEATKMNLEKPLHELMSDGEVLDITDPSLPNIAINVKLNLPSDFIFKKMISLQFKR